MNSAGTAIVLDKSSDSVAKPTNPIAYLLHALNQPVTGLQCSLELALTGKHNAEQNTRTLQEALDLTARIRWLVEALREVVEIQTMEPWTGAPALLNELVQEVVGELRPVAESRSIEITASTAQSLPVLANRAQLSRALFQFLESAVSLAAPGSHLLIEMEEANGRASVGLAWRHSEFSERASSSREELGLLIAETVWKQLGAEVRSRRRGDSQYVTLGVPLALAAGSGGAR